MATMTLVIPDEYLPRVCAAMERLYPIPTTTDGKPLFSSSEWANEAIRLFVIRSVHRWESHVATTNATKNVVEEPDLATTTAVPKS